MTDLAYFKNFSILFVEDEKDFVYIIKTFLSDVFKSVEVAYDGEEGLRKYQKGEFDIVLTDITMPIMNGFDMARKIKELSPLQKIVVLSAHKEESFINTAQSVGIDLYLHKPIGVDELLSGLAKALS
jgi:YesN/AraC family two-component response regulator